MEEHESLGIGPRSILLIVLLVVASCQHARRPDFMTRVREDCGAGQQWACDLLDALAKPPAAEDRNARSLQN